MSVALTAQVLDTQTSQSFDAQYERFPVRIGRNQLNDLHVDRPYISQFHASVELRDNAILIKDLGSTNGTLCRGQRLVRDQLVDVTAAPEINIGPIVIRLAVKDVKASAGDGRKGSVLDLGTPLGSELQKARMTPAQPGQEDPFVRQLAPYAEAYRSAWTNVYRLVYEHLTRLSPEVRRNYLRRLLLEQPALGQEADFQKVSQYYGVPVYDHGELSAPLAALAAVHELARTFAPDTPPPDDVPKLFAFARNLRDAMEVFLRCFVSLRDGHQAFETEVLRREREEQGNRVAAAKDHRELGIALFGPAADHQTPQHLQETFVEVMTHQVALMNGVMEGVKQLLQKLSPRQIEQEYEQRGKKGGLFSSKYEALWKLYEVRHGDYSGEDKETFLIIFGPQFSRAYAASAGEGLQPSGEQAGLGGVARYATSANQQTRR
ncbi:MAG: FHA domain-containing protein [Polyangiaceae bacterium]|nr:FHA domain-containing protein [Polyangiaceae bacterium]